MNLPIDPSCSLFIVTQYPELPERSYRKGLTQPNLRVAVESLDARVGRKDRATGKFGWQQSTSFNSLAGRPWLR